MSFFETFSTSNTAKAFESLMETKERDVEIALGKDGLTYADYLSLLSPVAEKHLDAMAIRALSITRRHFGKCIGLYIPLYLSNECDNSCVYCGFKKGNSIVRHTLDEAEIHGEMRRIHSFGMRNILLLTGEADSAVDIEYLERAVRIASQYIPSVQLEVYPLSEDEYRQLAVAGASGVTVYQETYHRPTYEKTHVQGKKSDFAWRINTPDRVLSSGIRRVGIGALLGLYDFRYEGACIGFHIQNLMRTYWNAEFSIGFPRLRPSVSNQYRGIKDVSEKNLAQMLFALRLFHPSLGLTISTRESPTFRDNIMPYGVTMMSAGSKTNPGGYGKKESTPQFDIDDERSVDEICSAIRANGFNPVFKDWDESFGAKESLPMLSIEENVHG